MNKVIFTTLIGLMLAGLFSFAPAAQAAPANLLINPGFESQGLATTDAANWTVYSRGYTRNSTPQTGSSSLRLSNSNNSQTSGAYQRVDLNQTTLQPVFIGGYVKGNAIQKASNSYFGASLYAEIHMNDGSVAYWNSIANVGTFDWRWIGFNTGTVGNVNKPIAYILVVPILGQARGTAYFDNLTVAQYAPTQGAVTIMIDDGEASTYTQAKPLMDQRGFKGSAAVMSGSVGDDGFMNRTQLRNLQTAGWEIVSHSISHEDLTLMSATMMDSELKNSKSALTRMGLAVKNFALPYGAYNGTVLGQSAKYYGSARAFEQGDNPQGTFPFEVKVRGVVETTTASDIAAWLNQAASQKRWLVLTYHSISATGDDAYHTSPAAFAAQLNQVMASGLPVLTYDQGLTMFGASK